MKKNIGILGICPPPFGGISTHCFRLATAFSEKGDYNATLIDMIPSASGEEKERNTFGYLPIRNKISFGLRLLFSKRFDLIHYHGNNPFATSLIILSLVSKFKTPVIVSFHSFRLKRPGKLRTALRIKLLKNFQRIICINQRIFNKVSDLGVGDEILEVVSPYIPPTKQNRKMNLALSIGSEPILLANVTRFTTYDGHDLYGTDMYIHLAKHLKPKFPNLVFIIVISTVNDIDKYSEYENLVNQLGLGNHVLFHKADSELVPILQSCDLLVRATNSDSFGMSVAEAISLGVPVVASDVVERTKGTITFTSRDQSDLNSKVVDVLDNLPYHRERIQNIEIQDDTILRLSQIYQDVLARNG